MKCKTHGKKLEYVCLQDTCEVKTCQVCETCFTTTHNHLEHNSMRLDNVFNLLESKERPSITLEARTKMRQEVKQFLADMRQVFNDSCVKLLESFDQYVRNMGCYNSLPYSKSSHQAQKLVRQKQIETLPSQPFRSLLVKRPGATGLLSSNDSDLQRFFLNFSRQLLDSLTAFQNGTIRLTQNPIFEMFDLKGLGKESASLPRINLIIEESMKKDDDLRHKSDESLRLTKHALKAENNQRPDEAADLYKLAISINPYNSAARNNYGLLLKSKGEIELAIKQFQESAKNNRNWAVPLVNHANCLRAVGKLDESLMLYNNALWVDPASYTALYNKAICLQSMSRNEQALKLIDSIKKLMDPDEDLLLLEGLCMSAIGRYEAAIELTDRIIKRNPANDDAFFNKSIALEKQGRRAEAYAAMKHACDLKPSNKEYRARLTSLQ